MFQFARGFLITAAVIVSIWYFPKKLCSQELPPVPPRAKMEKLAAEIVSKMSDEVKAGQIIHVAIAGKEADEDALKEIRKIRPGGVILFGMNLGTKEEIRTLTKDLQSEMKDLKLPPLLISTDQEGGRVVRVESGVTQFPSAMAVGQTANSDYAYKMGFATAYQLKKLGINTVFAPDLDINNNPENPVINTRSFGVTPDTVIKMGIAYEKGARSAGALSVIKHFPGHGDTNVDSHIGLPVIDKTEEELMQFELLPFKKAIEEGARSVMSAHIVFSKIDPDYPATLSPLVLKNILRNRLKFNGLVFTDAMEMDAISKNYKNVKRGVLAVLAGADVILMTSFGKNTAEYYDMILSAVKKKEFMSGEVNLIDEAIKRQLIAKMELGLFNESFSSSIINDDELKIYLQKRNKSSKEFYEYLKKENINDLNRKISSDAVRSWKNEFFPPSAETVKTFHFHFRQDRLKEEAELLGHDVISEKRLKKMLSKKIKGVFVLDSRDQSDLRRINSLIKTNPKADYILLHTGSPFLEFPSNPNVKVLFSFSPTDASCVGLVLRAFNSEEPVKPADIVYRKTMLK